MIKNRNIAKKSVHPDRLFAGDKAVIVVRAATTAALATNTYDNTASTKTASSNAALTVDGVSVSADDLILVKNESTTLQNGVYKVRQAGSSTTPFILVRFDGFAKDDEVGGQFVVVNAGTQNAGTLYVCNNALASDTVGTNNITFSELAKVGGGQAGDFKPSVKAATTTALAAYTRTSNTILADANGALAAVDGVTLSAGDRLLLKDGAAGADNGIYVVTVVGTAGSKFQLDRAADADESAEVTSGICTYVEQGTVNGTRTFYLTTTGSITLNTTALTFTGTLKPGNGFSAALDVNSQKITSLTAGTADSDAANFGQLAARDGKSSVRVATTGALAAYTRATNVITADANGALAAIDGVTLVAGERLLLKDGAAGADNGIYTVTTVGDGSNPFVLTRATDMDTSAKATCGAFVYIEEGTAGTGKVYRLTTSNPITLNTTALTFTQHNFPAGQGVSSSLNLNSQKIVSLATGTADADAATTAQVLVDDGKPSVRVATTTALAAYTRASNVITADANGALAAIDGITLVANERLLLKDGAAQADNGIYVVTQVGDGGTPFILTRATDADTSAKVTSGLSVYVEEGSLNGQATFRLSTTGAITLNTTGLNFKRDSFLSVASDSAVGTVNTTDATQTTVVSKTIVSSSTLHATAYVVGRNTSTDGEDVGYLLTGVFNRSGGGLTAVGVNQTSVIEHANSAGCDATMDASGNDLRVRVTGEAATNYTWKAWVELRSVA